jgi:hypothetical protein
VLFDLVKWALGEILVNPGDDASFNVTVQITPQVGQSPRRCGYDQRSDMALTHHFLEHCGYCTDEMMLLEVMPISRFDGAASGTHAGETAPWPVGALLMSWWVVVDEHPFGPQVWVFFVTVIAQEQRFAAIPDKNDCVVWNLDLAHAAVLPLNFI